MGIGSDKILQDYQETALKVRLYQQWRNRRFRRFEGQALADAIYKDAQAVITANGPLLDAEDSISPGFDSVKGIATIDFERLILSAPMVDSRYQGAFSGSIIAELALFSVSHFRFKFDPIFETTPFLPLLSRPIFSIN